MSSPDPSRGRHQKPLARLAKIAAGFGLLVAGIVMLPLPGPGWLTIAAGLGILAAEFRWARTALDRLKSAATWVGRLLQQAATRISRATSRLVQRTPPGR